jgi:hypothetical protein
MPDNGASGNLIALGVDVSTRALAIAGIRDDDRRSIVTRKLELNPKARGARRLVAARTVAHAALGGHATEACVIAIEVPIIGGRANNKELLAVAYVVVEAAQAACPNAIVMDVPLSTWRKHVLGHGNADKAAALAYGTELGYTDGDDDVAEALCVAEYGWGRWRTATREQAA